ncbi:MAG: hypothetical protein HC847_26315, partial [Hydrococcus sp. RU_2_2]|nr:hypothetical protein [Hydrococcus sp. RU_2_2]
QVYLTPGYRYRPWCVVDSSRFFVHLWIGPRANCYYFGNYYGGFNRWGFSPWCDWNYRNRRCYDPIWSWCHTHYRRQGVDYIGLGPSAHGLEKSGAVRRWNIRDYAEWIVAVERGNDPVEGAEHLTAAQKRLIERVINAFEDSGFLLKDVLAWKKPSAHHRAQKVSIVFERRNLPEKAEEWEGWRLGNLAPIYEPIAWFSSLIKLRLPTIF